MSSIFQLKKIKEIKIVNHIATLNTITTQVTLELKLVDMNCFMTQSSAVGV